MELLIEFAILLVGLVALVWSSDKMVYGAAALAHNFGISHLIIGLTIVAFGTSAPEILVSMSAALDDAVELAAGNALGSNVANIGLVLGVTALLVKLPVNKMTAKRDAWVLLSITLMAAYFIWDLTITRLEGILLFAAVIAYLALIFIQAKSGKSSETELEEVDEEEIPVDVPKGKAAMWFVLGLVVLLISANFIVESATFIAEYFNVSQLVIGATIVAIGTSLPELAASVAGALRGHYDMVIGNIIGSNIFNLGAVLAVAAVINPSELPDAAVFNRDMAFVLITTVLLVLSTIIMQRINRRIGRSFGIVAVALYCVYLYFNFQAAI